MVIFVTTKFDNMNVNKGNAWAFALKSPDKILYIEREISKTNNLSEEKYQKLVEESYFRGMTKVDENINIVSIDEENIPLNIYINSDENIKIKVKEFLEEMANKYQEQITLVFENSIDYVYFINTAFNFNEEGELELYDFMDFASIILETILTLTDSFEGYLDAKDDYIQKLDDGENDKDAVKRLTAVTDAFILETTYFMLIEGIINGNYDEENEVSEENND